MKKTIILLLAVLCIAKIASAEVRYTLKFPAAADTLAKKTAYCYLVKEKLRLQHNEKGDDYLNGIITKEEWAVWKREVFNPKQDAIFARLLQAREIFKTTTAYGAVNLDATFEIVNP